MRHPLSNPSLSPEMSGFERNQFVGIGRSKCNAVDIGLIAEHDIGCRDYLNPEFPCHIIWNTGYRVRHYEHFRHP